MHPTVDLSRAALRIRDFFGAIAEAASVRASGHWSATALRCRRRPGHKPCKGRIEIFRKDIPPDIEWRCPVCEDGGVITGWKGTHWDLSGRSTAPKSARRVEGREEGVIPAHAAAVLRGHARAPSKQRG